MKRIEKKMMKKVMTIGCLAAMWMAVASCASTKNVATLTSLDGEWNIIEIAGEIVVPAPGQAFPFIAFNAETGQVYGNTGCNNLTGSIQVNEKPGRVDLASLGSTRRACQDMQVEQQVLSALAQVNKYKQLNGENMLLYGSKKKDGVVLQRRQPTMTFAELDGKWLFVEAMGELIPDTMEMEPFIEFKVAEKRLHGRAGCNIINGDVVLDADNDSAISFPDLIRTMMHCPDMAVEENIVNALRTTATFGKGKGLVEFYNAEGVKVLVLKKAE